MFDLAAIGQQLQPGDKISLTFHKNQPKTAAGGSFMDNAQQAGLVPGGPAASMPAGPAASMPGMGAPPAGPDTHALLVAAMRQRMGLA
jgi:hypothetical protein